MSYFALGEARTTQAFELARQAHDRVSLLEHGHHRLFDQSEFRFAVNAEFNDWVVNRSEEDWIEISGSLHYCYKPFSAKVDICIESVGVETGLKAYHPRQTLFSD